MRVDWPEEIEIPGRIGIGRFRYRNSRPCCAIGHYAKAIGVDFNLVPASIESAFATCANALKECAHTYITEINDFDLADDERVLVYAAALAYVGYTLHNFSEAEELARKAKVTK